MLAGDLSAVNTLDNPDRVKPVLVNEGGNETDNPETALPPASFHLLRFKVL
jgi:alpha-L-arabinofuranosidase